MDDSSGAFVGLDAGRSLTLLALWPSSPERSLDQLDPIWPVRAPIRALQAVAGVSGAEIRQAVAALCAEHSVHPANCALVCMGDTHIETIRDMAAVSMIPAVIRPATRCALTTEGALPTQGIREYDQAVPNSEHLDLDVLRDCFAELMERASEDLQTAELDQDDAVLDRFIDAAYSDRKEVLTIPAEWLSDEDRLLKSFHRAHAARFGRSDERAAVKILAARLRCITVAMYRPNLAGNTEPSAAVSAPPGWTQRTLNGGHLLWTRSGAG